MNIITLLFSKLDTNTTIRKIFKNCIITLRIIDCRIKYKRKIRIIDRFNLITFIDSTLGYESISRGKKIVSFSP